MMGTGKNKGRGENPGYVRPWVSDASVVGVLRPYVINLLIGVPADRDLPETGVCMGTRASSPVALEAPMATVLFFSIAGVVGVFLGVCRR